MAEQLSSLGEIAQASVLEELNGETLKVGLLVRYPARVEFLTIRVIRLGERSSVPGSIDILL